MIQELKKWHKLMFNNLQDFMKILKQKKQLMIKKVKISQTNSYPYKKLI